MKIPAYRNVYVSVWLPDNASRPAIARAMLGGFEANILIKAFIKLHLPYSYVIMIVETKK